ncbi:hypothetical protein ACTJKT_02310, partial [Pseudomonas sp. 22526]|uniref:hypothetical protein n=1 Tax=Pseudomonas sp. 22526 TaxID=3453937 RepID=UPI003F85DBC0
NPKVVGSNPAPATKHQKRLLERVAFFVRVRFVATPCAGVAQKTKPFAAPGLNPLYESLNTYLTQWAING